MVHGQHILADAVVSQSVRQVVCSVLHFLANCIHIKIHSDSCFCTDVSMCIRMYVEFNMRQIVCLTMQYLATYMHIKTH